MQTETTVPQTKLNWQGKAAPRTRLERDWDEISNEPDGLRHIITRKKVGKKLGDVIAEERATFVNSREIHVGNKVYRTINAWATANNTAYQEETGRKVVSVGIYDSCSGISFIRKSDGKRVPMADMQTVERKDMSHAAAAPVAALVAPIAPVAALVAPIAPVAPAPPTSDVVTSTFEAALEMKQKEIEELEKMAKEAIDKAEKKKKASILIQQALDAIRD